MTEPDTATEPSDRPDAARATPKTAEPTFLERYGPPALASVLGLVVIEMAVLTPLIHYGLDLTPFYVWIESTFGVDVAPAGDGRPGWIASAVIAWTVRRPLKPLEFAAAAVITPFVARLPMFRSGPDGGAGA